MKGLMENEMMNATWIVELTAPKGLLPVDAETVKTVTSDLQSTFQELLSGGNSSPTNPRFPQDQFEKEPDSYLPLAHLLNKMITTASQYISQSHLRGLRFFPFDHEMNEIIDSKKPLKPDGVGIIREELPTKPVTEKKNGQSITKAVYDLPWGLVEIFFESKASIPDMVRHCAAYARCCNSSNPRRFFNLGIGFQYKSMEAYVFAFHHGGLSSSHPLKIRTPEGFNGLVEHIVGILSIKDEAAYGLDPTRCGDYFYINDRFFKSVGDPLYVRGNLRGRSTIVHGLVGVYMRILVAGLHLFIA
jgi:hypothetical protein